MTKNNINANTFEVLQPNNIEYSRKGGYFVTTKKALVYLIVTIALSSIVGLLVYQYGPHKNREEVVEKQENIQELLEKTIRNLPIQNIKLPESVRPIHYKLKLTPEIENFIFSGEVSIIIEVTEKAKFIVLNVDELKLYNISIVKNVDKAIQRRRNVMEESLTEAKNTKGNVSTWTIQGNTAELKRANELENVTMSAVKLPSMTVNEQTSNTPGLKSTNVDIAVTATTPLQTTTADYIQKIPNLQETNKVHAPILDTIHVLSRQINRANLQYNLHLSKLLLPGKTYTLTISFSGRISESLQGLHQSSYINNQGKKKYIIASHFQPIYARRVFPCFDEPSMKATFEISIVHNKTMKALSNMPVKTTSILKNGLVEDLFETSPPMPTFQVAFIMMDSDYYSNKTNSNSTQISVWAPNEHIHYASYALASASKLLNYFNEYYNITYPLPKLDIVTIPNLPSTATENWGLMFFKESTLLNDVDDRQIFIILAKKIAQQWFGNAVSIQWWNDLWVIKGFAVLMSEVATVRVNNWTSDFTLKVMQNMLALDDFKSVPSLQVDIKNVIQINELIDSIITHYKGACLLRMLKASLPDELFEKSIENLIKQWEYKSIDQNNVWTSIYNETKMYLPDGKHIFEIMAGWSTQTGYPLITVTRNIKTGDLHVSQRKFQALNVSDDNSLWIVPLNYIIGDDGEEHKFWLTNRSLNIVNATEVASDKWILFNVRRTGYYRVNYDKNNWNLLIKVLIENNSRIPIENRGQLINDAFKLAENDLLHYQIPFNLTRYLRKERNYIPWASVLNSLDFLYRILRSTYLNGAYEEYITSLIQDLYDELSNDTTTNDEKLRQLIIETACNVNYEPCVDWAKERFADWMNDNISVPYNLRETIFCTAIRTGRKEEWNFLWNQIEQQKTNTHVQELFMSLGCSRDKWLINKYLKNSLNGSISWQYVPYVWKSLSHPSSIAFGFKYLRENWDTIYQAYKDKPIILKAIVKDFLFGLSSKSDLEDLTLFVSKHEKDLQELAVLIQGVVDRIKVRVAWSAKYLSHMEQILSQEITS